WIRRFCERHKDRIKSIYLRGIDQSRKIADNSAYFEYFYQVLHEKIEKYRIRPSNIYNFDEKGFLLGLCRTMKRIVA
ncbi:hypothetical protein DM02DRAFT_471042, partial [Periconia macrospinosa]